jgi:Protein of unknown function (DUF3147)
MIVRIRPAALRESHWHEYLIRFVLGGLATAFAGAVAALYGAETGGLFLAFPAVFSASATLIEKHERERKKRLGLQGSKRGKDAAALDAVGTSVGSFGLAAFGAVIWELAPSRPWVAILAGSVAWCVVAVTLWFVRQKANRINI